MNCLPCHLPQSPNDKSGNKGPADVWPEAAGDRQAEGPGTISEPSGPSRAGMISALSTRSSYYTPLLASLSGRAAGKFFHKGGAAATWPLWFSPTVRVGNEMPEHAVTAGQATVHLGRDEKTLEQTSRHLPMADTGLTFPAAQA